ncbi:MAG: hypothetical protein E7C94_02455 [Finegoldia magna]|uniref:hypothetical protein n=1 Tax=Finegoldia magna TaxID=1260 RepID=UPI002901CC37|nr:hypothetical protein [Finegoldia magna]MDU2574771.1 hypothetical protein [Finegoldia magna]
MKTKEFAKKVKDLGYKIVEGRFDNGANYFKIIRPDGITDSYVAIDKFLEMSVYSNLVNEELFDLVVEYAKTPIKDREEEKRYYLKHRYLQSSFTNLNDFLSYSASDNKLALSNGINFPKYKTHFTLKEIEEIKEKFDTDLSDYELVKVEE